MNIMSCHIFVKYSISTVILTSHNVLGPYYFSKWIFVVEIEGGCADNIPIIVKKNDVTNLHKEESILKWRMDIP